MGRALGWALGGGSEVGCAEGAAAARGRSLATHQGAAGSRVGVGQVFGW